MATHWTELTVHDVDGNSRNLEDFLAESTITGLELRADGGIKTWDGIFVTAPGEEPSPDTPLVPVDWTGFADAVAD